MTDPNAVMEAMKASLATAMPTRHVQRDLVDPAKEKLANLSAGVICVVSAGGGQFGNWNGREGDLGTMKVSLVGFLQVDAKSDPSTVEIAELALLAELLSWCQQAKAEPLDEVFPLEYRQSQQLSHPLGWLALDLEVRHV